jgi:DNA-binding transcriptional ArsR family regulator
LEGIVTNASPAPALVDRRLIKAVSNPTRVDIFINLLEGGPSSPSKIAKQLDCISVNLVAHHIKVLRDLGCVELVDEIKHGGRTERIYRATKRHFFSAEESEFMDAEDVRSITLDILRLISNDIEISLLANAFDRLTDNHLSRVPLRLDREGWGEVVRILGRTLEEVQEAGERSVERAGAGGEELMDVRVAMMQFPMSGNQD